MEQLAEKKYYSPEEYLALEEKADYKSEYYKGEIFALAGTSVNHNRIVGNLSSRLNQMLANKKCEAFSTDVKLWIREKDLFTYPDITIVCGKIEFYPGRDDTITNPLVIFEVLSESTKNYDRGEKFLFYRAIPTFQEYVLIDQTKIHVEHFYIGEQGKWVLTEYNAPDDVLKLTKVDFEMPLRDIYQRVEFGVIK